MERHVKRVVEIIETATGDVVHRTDVSDRGPRETEKIEATLNQFIDHARFHTRIVPELPKEKGVVER